MNTRGSVRFLCLCVLGGSVSQASQEPPGCPEIRFQEPASLRERVVIEQVEGEVVVVMPATHPAQFAHVGDMCLALFRARSKTQVATVATEKEGAFRFDDPGVGDYVLIGKENASGGKGRRLRPLLVPLRVLAPATRAPQRGLALRVSLEGDKPPAATAIIGDVQLRRQLLERLKIDQGVRTEQIRQDITKPRPELEERMKSIDAETDVWLKEIVREHGWPGSDLVGLDGASAASTMLMHVPPETQNHMLPLVEAAFKGGAVTGSTYAMLFDHLRVAAGQPQRYGTVAKPITADRQVVFFPIEDEASVDARRKEMGLSSLAEYRELMKQLYLPEKK
jgi:hypothetical protein